MSDNRNDDFEFDKDLEIDVDIELDYDVEVDVDVDIEKDICIDIYSDVDLDGNYAELTLDAEAIGSDTLVEAIVSVLTVEDELSSISLNVISAAD